ncbi:MAG: vitamin K epoxide reductase family protein [Candidatus Paceibacteria bacterium]
MTSFALLFTLSAIGISETVYLIRKRIASEKPVCPIGKGCTVVLSSRYSKMFLIPNDVLGLSAYIVSSFFAAFLVIGVEPMLLWNFGLKILVAVASLMSIFFTYLQWRVIHAWCFWCLMSAFTIWLMGIIILISAAI